MFSTCNHQQNTHYELVALLSYLHNCLKVQEFGRPSSNLFGLLAWCLLAFVGMLPGMMVVIYESCRPEVVTKTKRARRKVRDAKQQGFLLTLTGDEVTSFWGASAAPQACRRSSSSGTPSRVSWRGGASLSSRFGLRSGQRMPWARWALHGGGAGRLPLLPFGLCCRPLAAERADSHR